MLNQSLWTNNYQLQNAFQVHLFIKKEARKLTKQMNWIEFEKEKHLTKSKIQEHPIKTNAKWFTRLMKQRCLFENDNFEMSKQLSKENTDAVVIVCSL